MYKKEIQDNHFLFEAKYMNNAQQLISDRANSCLRWYIQKACLYKWIFYLGSLTTLCCPLVASVIVGISTVEGTDSIIMQVITIILGVISSIAAGILALFHAQDKWTRYRSASEFLKREIMLYKAGANEHSSKDAHIEFLKTIEEYMKAENIEWNKSEAQNKNNG